MPEPLLTRAEVAARLLKSERTLRRMLPGLMAANPALRPIQAGRAMLFTEEDYALLLESLRCPSPPTYVGKPGAHTALSVSVSRSSPSASSAKERVREILRKAKA